MGANSQQTWKVEGGKLIARNSCVKLDRGKCMKWEKVNERKPLERKLYEQDMEKLENGEGY